MSFAKHLVFFAGKLKAVQGSSDRRSEGTNGRPTHPLLDIVISDQSPSCPINFMPGVQKGSNRAKHWTRQSSTLRLQADVRSDQFSGSYGI